MMSQHVMELYRGPLKFSSGHFTIFSATERESLHGHNYYLEVKFHSRELAPGIVFDYRDVKNKLVTMCQRLHTKFLLPTQSPFLSLVEEGDYWVATFNQKKLFFLKEDVVLLPLRNISLEELSAWFVRQLEEDPRFIEENAIDEIVIKVFNGLEQSAQASWTVAAAPRVGKDSGYHDVECRSDQA